MAETPLEYSVLGGCVTRDAVDLGERPLPKPVNYFSRTRIQSVVSPPTPIDPDSIDLASAYQKRMVVWDFDKTPARVLPTLDHPLVIDLVGERSPLARTPHGLVTASQYYNNAKLGEREGITPVTEDRKLADDGPFATAVRQFADLIPDSALVVIHRCFWATVDIDGADVPKRPLSEKSNKWLTRAYALLEEALGARATTVEVVADLRVADPGHRWGLAPFHFPDAYYTELCDQVRAVLRGRTGERSAARVPSAAR